MISPDAAPGTTSSDRASTVLRGAGLRARKSLSQSFLSDPRVASSIIHLAALDPGKEEVLEVGPGLGILTERLLPLARRVVAVEIDQNLVRLLSERLTAANLDLRQGDVLRMDPAEPFADAFVVVANLPYHITSPALRHLLAAGPPFASRLIVMVQREVADRIVALPGQLSALAVTLQAQADVGVLLPVAASAFHPRPKVDSSVLAIRPKVPADRLVPREQVAQFSRFTYAGFTQPRKQLVNSLGLGLKLDRARVIDLLAGVGISSSKRPQELLVREWVALWEAAQAHGVLA